MAMSRNEDPSRLSDEQIQKIGAVAEYGGAVYGHAKAQVLDYLSMGHTFEDALELIRAGARQVVRQNVQTTAQKITEYRIPQAVLDVAMELAEGDISRLRIDPEDGSITVVNQSRKPGA